MATRLQITSGGNVGVGGVTTPMNKLDVEGNMVVGATYSGTNTAPTNGLLVQGYVGIGTTTVAAPLHVAGTSAIFGVGEGGTPTATTIRGAIATGTDIPGANLAIRPANGTGTGGSGSLIFQTAAAGATSATANTMATRLQITSGGNVGVGGVTTPMNKLDIEGNMVVGATYSGVNTAPTNGLLVEGNVGIGTTAPNAKLKVDGGQIAADQNVIASGATVDFNNGNVQVLQSVGGTAITLNNMVDGAAYTLIITDVTARTYTFTNCTNSHFTPSNGSTVASRHTIYTILKVTISTATHCYISWLPDL